MNYNGIMWGPSMRGYLSDNKARIGRCEASLVSLKNQDGQFAREHRMLLDVFRDMEAVILKHIELADAAAEEHEVSPLVHKLPGHDETIAGLNSLTIRP